MYWGSTATNYLNLRIRSKVFLRRGKGKAWGGETAMNIVGFKRLFEGLSKTSLAKFQQIVIKVSIGLEFASLGSAKWLKSMMLIYGYSHCEQMIQIRVAAAEHSKCGSSQRNPLKIIFLMAVTTFWNYKTKTDDDIHSGTTRQILRYMTIVVSNVIMIKYMPLPTKAKSTICDNEQEMKIETKNERKQMRKRRSGKGEETNPEHCEGIQGLD
ncbi:Phosphatidylinositol 4-kinase gamma 1 [Senna tora]|uniref:Phosphatidylinositol 4-kinase gamma 1 n=1 Tax=Senna tora TaxID=362788 RepID=A0A834SI30_9FABA|nr:Phosphatidylinositol 4-kinase gamma 1 [Senna tora]